jgi:hypothetical protein
MQHQAVTIHDGYHTIDPDAWVALHVGDEANDHTAALRDFLRNDAFRDYTPQMDTSARMQLWCAGRGWVISEASPLHHDHSVLDRPVTLVLATDIEDTPHALVQIGTDQPTVYRDITTDDDYWLHVETVDIICPAGHRWTWLNDRELLDHAGRYLTLTDLFGQRRGAPYSRCRDCAAFDDGYRDESCPCDNPNVIYCPACQQRCHLELAAVPTHPAVQR